MYSVVLQIKNLVGQNLTGTKKKIASNTIYQIIGKLVSMSITVLAVMIVTRTYGKAGYGEFSLMQSWPALFFVVVDFGINAIAARELTTNWNRAGDYFSSILLFRILFTTILILILNLILIFFPYSQSLSFGIRISLLLVLTQALYSTGNIFFQVKLKYDYSVISYLLGYVVILGLVLYFSYIKAPVYYVSFSYVLGGLVTFFMSLCFLKKLGVTFSFNFDKELIKRLFFSALPLGVMFLFSQMSFKEDALMLSVLKLPENYNLTNTESVAVYALPYKIFEVCLVVPTFFMNATYPVLVKKMEGGKDKLKSAFLKTLKFLLIAGIVFGIIGQLIVPLSISILGGADFVESIIVLRILIAGLVLYFLTSPLAWLIVTLGEQKKLPIIYALSALFNLVANLVFIPKYSFYAATVITQLSEIFILIMLVIVAKNSWKHKYGQF